MNERFGVCYSVRLDFFDSTVDECLSIFVALTRTLSACSIIPVFVWFLFRFVVLAVLYLLGAVRVSHSVADVVLFCHRARCVLARHRKWIRGTQTESRRESTRVHSSASKLHMCVFGWLECKAYNTHSKHTHIHTNTIVCSYQFRWLARALPFFLFSVFRPFVFHALSHTLAAAQCAFALSRSLEMLWQWCGACVSLFVALHSLWTRARRTQRLAVLFTFTLSPCDSFRQSDDVCVCVCVCVRCCLFVFSPLSVYMYAWALHTSIWTIKRTHQPYIFKIKNTRYLDIHADVISISYDTILLK